MLTADYNGCFAGSDPAGATSTPEGTDKATIFEAVLTAHRQLAPD
jgi:hypothetical protein